MLVRWSLPLCVAVLCLAIQLSGATEGLRYERALIGEQPWRLVTGHLTHLGWAHLWLNLAGLALIWVLFGHLLQIRTWVAALVVSALMVSGGLYLFDTDLAWYVGLSGVLHGLLVLGALASWREEPRIALLLLAVAAAKLAWEQFTGIDTGTGRLVGGAVIVNAHLYGALGGLACIPLMRAGRTHDNQVG